MGEIFEILGTNLEMAKYKSKVRPQNSPKFILLKSGDIIPMSRLGFKQLVKAISLSITGSDAFDY